MREDSSSCCPSSSGGGRHGYTGASLRSWGRAHFRWDRRPHRGPSVVLLGFLDRSRHCFGGTHLLRRCCTWQVVLAAHCHLPGSSSPPSPRRTNSLRAAVSITGCSAGG